MDLAVEGRPLYLDAQSTTPIDPRVLDVMLPYLTSYYGNPHSRTHAYGWESENAVEKARKVKYYFYSHPFLFSFIIDMIFIKFHDFILIASCRYNWC